MCCWRVYVERPHAAEGLDSRGTQTPCAQFVNWAKPVCEHLRKAGCFADWVDPCSGLPVRSNFRSDLLFRTCTGPLLPCRPRQRTAPWCTQKWMDLRCCAGTALARLGAARSCTTRSGEQQCTQPLFSQTPRTSSCKRLCWSRAVKPFQTRAPCLHTVMLPVGRLLLRRHSLTLPQLDSFGVGRRKAWQGETLWQCDSPSCHVLSLCSLRSRLLALALRQAARYSVHQATPARHHSLPNHKSRALSCLVGRNTGANAMLVFSLWRPRHALTPHPCASACCSRGLAEACLVRSRATHRNTARWAPHGDAGPAK